MSDPTTTTTIPEPTKRQKQIIEEFLYYPTGHESKNLLKEIRDKELAPAKKIKKINQFKRDLLEMQLAGRRGY